MMFVGHTVVVRPNLLVNRHNMLPFIANSSRRDSPLPERETDLQRNPGVSTFIIGSLVDLDLAPLRRLSVPTSQSKTEGGFLGDLG
jgi:hypothetical protein